jgi:hypothetical protein
MTLRAWRTRGWQTFACVFGSEEVAPKGFDDDVVITFKVNHIFEFVAIFEIA